MKEKGLTKEEVNWRIEQGLVNKEDNTRTKTIKEIILGNIITYFNLLNFFLALAIIISGIIDNNMLYSLKNCLFLGVVLCNTTISIVQEIMSKKTIDRLSLLNEVQIKVLRDGKLDEISREEIVQDDIIFYTIGSQILVDSVILNGEVEVNESFITGEADSIKKKAAQELTSGSFIVSGSCYAKVIHVGKENYINTISNETKKLEYNKSVIFNSFEKLVRLLSYILLPLGMVLFFNQYFFVHATLADSIINTVAALIGMIPEGLVLLTSSVMAVSVVRLSKEKVLVQQLYCIETLARVNVICLDKTGTLTTGNMHVKEVVGRDKTKDELEEIIKVLLNVLPDNSSTFKAIRDKYSEKRKVLNTEVIPFSSERKYSACSIANMCYYVGAPEYVLQDDLSLIDEEISKKQEEYRVLVIAAKKGGFKSKNKLSVLGYILIEDEVRPDAYETLAYFQRQGVRVKIISGDNYKTVLNIAHKVGLHDIKGIDCTNLEEKKIDTLVLENDIFGRVTPYMKQKLVKALKKNGYIVAMTGDGVNDVLALLEADCSVAMASGADAAKSISQLVLLNSDFACMPKIVDEGRRNINNIERSASLLLVKTIYTILLILTSIIFQHEYFFIPIQLTLITSCTIGIPSFILALEPNHQLVDGKNFLGKIIQKSLPGGLTVFLNIVIILCVNNFLGMNREMVNVLAVMVTAMTGFIHLFHISRPFNYLRATMFFFLVLLFSYGVFFHREFFLLHQMNNKIIFTFLGLFLFSILSYQVVLKLVHLLFTKKITK